MCSHFSRAPKLYYLHTVGTFVCPGLLQVSVGEYKQIIRKFFCHGCSDTHSTNPKMHKIALKTASGFSCIIFLHSQKQ